MEPVFAYAKHLRRIDRFSRRGRAAVEAEWQLTTATHNVLKLHRESNPDYLTRGCGEPHTNDPCADHGSDPVARSGASRLTSYATGSSRDLTADTKAAEIFTRSTPLVVPPAFVPAGRPHTPSAAGHHPARPKRPPRPEQAHSQTQTVDPG